MGPLMVVALFHRRAVDATAAQARGAPGSRPPHECCGTRRRGVRTADRVVAPGWDSARTGRGHRLAGYAPRRSGRTGTAVRGGRQATAARRRRVDAYQLRWRWFDLRARSCARVCDNGSTGSGARCRNRARRCAMVCNSGCAGFACPRSLSSPTRTWKPRARTGAWSTPSPACRVWRSAISRRSTPTGTSTSRPSRRRCCTPRASCSSSRSTGSRHRRC